MSDSILTSTKKVLGIADGYTAFDADIVMHINSVFSTLNQLGIGPVDGFMIEDKTPTWDAFLSRGPWQNNVKSYLYLQVRMWFDPPQTHYLITAMEAQITELVWRINNSRETVDWVDPNPPPSQTIFPFGEFFFDGGVFDGGDA